MSEERKSPRRISRRRRANIDGDTQYVRVSMSEFERAQLKVLEERTGRSPSEILVSAALYAENSESLAERRAMAVAHEQEMRARVVEAEAEVPRAMAEAFRKGALGVMDYYRMQNIQADSTMREAIADQGNQGDQPKPPIR